MDVRSILRAKRDGHELDEEAIRFFLEGYVAGSVPDYCASSLLTSIFVHGMGEAELVVWTRAMLESGICFAWGDVDRPVVDKHSTGGVGDKVSLPLAAAVAACGAAVPMISGRGLGHTGGTLDKLESIPGLRTELEPEKFRAIVREVGCVIAAQSADLVPADAKLYALRDATGLIESVPLIASSILSKKLAEGLDALVLDVKYGSGSFVPEVKQGEELAHTMLSIARGMGLSTVCFQTAMDRPLGLMIGNALEVSESLDCLRGAGPSDLRELVCTLGGSLLQQVRITPDPFAGRTRIAHALDDGSAFQCFQGMVAAQGGDPKSIEAIDGLERTNERSELAAAVDGYVDYGDVRALGVAVAELGGGREAPGEAIDAAVGLELLVRPGEQVRAGDPLLLLHHRAGRGLEAAKKCAAAAFEIRSSPAAVAGTSPLVLARVES